MSNCNEEVLIRSLHNHKVVGKSTEHDLPRSTPAGSGRHRRERNDLLLQKVESSVQCSQERPAEAGMFRLIPRRGFHSLFPRLCEDANPATH